jgi:chromate transporter
LKELFDLFFTFARIGAVTFGGGYAMLPILQREIAEKRQWATEDELLDYYAIGQCTPGIIAVNVATFIGYKQRGIGGAISATLGLIFPSLVIIMIIAAFVQGFSDYEVVKNAFCGIRVCVCVLVFDAVYKLWKKAVVDKATLAVFLVVLVLALFTSVPVAALVVLAGVAGVAINKAKGMVTKK